MFKPEQPKIDNDPKKYWEEHKKNVRAKRQAEAHAWGARQDDDEEQEPQHPKAEDWAEQTEQDNIRNKARTKGDILWGDELLLLFARDILKRNPHAAIIGEVKCSQKLYDDIARNNGRAIMWKAGHSLIKGKMKEENALLAGEMSGHIFFADRYFGYDDAIYASLRLLELLSGTGMKLSELLADVPRTFTTPEIRVDCPDRIKFRVVDAVREYFLNIPGLIAIDGVRIPFIDGWGLVRASNTQPVLVLRFEAATEERLAVIRKGMEDVLDGILKAFARSV